MAAEGPGRSAANLDAAARGRREVSTEEALERQRHRSLRWWTDARSGMVRLSGRLADVDGETVMRALDRIAGRLRREPGGEKEPFDALHADALVELASSELAEEVDGDRACVVLHLPASGSPVVGDDLTVATETARRVACDATLQALITDAFANPIGLSPRRRTVSPALMRFLRRRDGRCRFPGCERTRTLRAHHLVHAADGGPTEASNLACLCAWHHHLVHEGGWHLTGDPTRPDGPHLPKTRRPAPRDHRPTRQPTPPQAIPDPGVADGACERRERGAPANR